MTIKRLFGVVLVMILSGCSAHQVPSDSGEGLEDMVATRSWSGDIVIRSIWPDQVAETSGLAIRGDVLWTINDSGDGARIYSLKNNKIDRVVDLENAKNIDWEDLAQDKDFLYIADCGNNRGKRRSIQIYKVAWQELESKNSVSEYDTLHLRYVAQPDQVNGKLHNYDCEALVSVEDELWLFSKNRKDESTWMYRVSKTQKDQVINVSDKFPVRGLVTAVDYDPKTKRLVLLGYSKQRIFGHSFLWVVPVRSAPIWEEARYIQLYPYAQWEALVWDYAAENGRILISSEKNPLLDVSVGELYLPAGQGM